MKKLRSLTLLQDFLDAEFAWRIKEVAYLKITVRRTSSPVQSTVIRAAVPLLYAHWEGFIKNSSTAYINFVNNQLITYDRLASCFIVFGLKNKLHQLKESRKSRVSVAAVDFLLGEMGKRAELSWDNAVNTQSNLSASVFENIALSVGIDPAPYKARYKLIDESLLKRRNEIAHGEFLDVNAGDYRSLADEVLLMMRFYKTDIENAAATNLFLR